MSGSVVSFLRDLIAIPSLPGAEGDLASRVVREMSELGYDDVWVDEVGNVLGRIRGSGSAPPLLFNTHLDHVDVGDPARWPRPPYAAEVHAGQIWGRGAVDIKGPLAAQVHAGGRLVGGERPPGDVLVTAVVQEELGGLGARQLASQRLADLVVIGEPSGNTVRRGHRGRFELEVRVRGRSVHASVPASGVNPLVSLGALLARLDEVELGSDEGLGASSLAPTLVATDQTSANVVPGEARLTLDWRNVPGESEDDAAARVRGLLEDCLRDGATGEVTIPLYERRSYNGAERSLPAQNPAYVLAADHPLVAAAADLAAEVLGRECRVGLWRFATDGGHFAAAGASPVGFGPGDESLAHTVDERIEIAELEAAVAVYERFGRRLATAATAH